MSVGAKYVADVADVYESVNSPLVQDAGVHVVLPVPPPKAPLVEKVTNCADADDVAVIAVTTARRPVRAHLFIPINAPPSIDGVLSSVATVVEVSGWFRVRGPKRAQK